MLALSYTGNPRVGVGVEAFSLQTGNQAQLDLRVLKFFEVGEHGKLDFVVGSFNLLNHKNVVALNQFYGVGSSPLAAFATPNKAGIPMECSSRLTSSLDYSRSLPAQILRSPAGRVPMKRPCGARFSGGKRVILRLDL